MKMSFRIALVVFAICMPTLTPAQVAVQASDDQQLLLASKNAQTAVNKRLVYDFWREVIEGGHLELADKYLTENYIQHNPNVPDGRSGFVSYFSKFLKPHPLDSKLKSPLVGVVAEGDLVVLSFATQNPEPGNAGKSYTTTWFDMFRIESGKIAEHWDPALKDALPATRADAGGAPTIAEDTFRLDPALLQQYVGKYKVTEVSPAIGDIPADWAISIRVVDGQLIAEISGEGLHTNGAVAFQAKAVDEFFRVTTGARINFLHDQKGAVGKVILNASGHAFAGLREEG